MAFVHLDIRCLYTVLICTSFGCVLSSNTEIKVNPPLDFEIVDPGYLGYISMQWKPPLSLDNFKECTVEYELKYRNFDRESWKTIITTNLYYKDGFDLNKGIEAKIHTLLPEQCTNGSEVYSSWSEATYWTPPQGRGETKIQDLDCEYYNWQYLLCSWKPGVDVPFDTNYNLFYWYEGLDQAIECAEYMTSNGKNTGCRFPHLKSPDYKDFYICVNGSSQSMLIRSSYFIFQLQNIVKPLPPEYLSLTMKDSNEISLKWNVPRGPIPERCFFYEIILTEDYTTWVDSSCQTLSTVADLMAVNQNNNKENKQTKLYVYGLYSFHRDTIHMIAVSFANSVYVASSSLRTLENLTLIQMLGLHKHSGYLGILPFTFTTMENEMCIKRTSNKSHQICLLVRSKVNIYCSDDGIWSEWSEEECWKGDTWKEIVIYFMIPFGFISLFVLLVTLLLLYKQRSVLETIFDSRKEVFTRQETLC